MTAWREGNELVKRIASALIYLIASDRRDEMNM